MQRFTESELILRYKYYISEMVGMVENGEDAFAISDTLPFVVHFNSPKDLAVQYVNNNFTSITGYDLEQLLAGGAEIFEEYVHPDSLAAYPNLLKLSTDAGETPFTFIHHVRMRGPRKPEYRPLITITKPMNRLNASKFCISAQPHEFGNWHQRILNIVELDSFKVKHFALFNRLTMREKDVMRLLTEGLGNPQIADRLYISRSTVETHRKNLKAKLGLKSYKELLRFSVAFGIVSIQ